MLIIEVTHLGAIFLFTFLVESLRTLTAKRARITPERRVRI
jgi:hypothetical protein